MSLDLTLVSRNRSRRATTWLYSAVPHAATNYTAGGDTIDLTGASATGEQTLPYHAPTNNEVVIEVVKGGHSVDFVADASPTFANGKLKIYTASATELAAGAYPATLTQIMFSVTQSKGKSSAL